MRAYGSRLTIAAIAAVSLEISRPALAAYDTQSSTCSGPSNPQPEGPPQYGSCRGLLPFSVLGGFAGSVLNATQLPVPSAAKSVMAYWGAEGQDWLLSKAYTTHKGSAPCSFGPPGENRHVADKFAIDGFVDFPLATIAVPGVPSWLRINRVVAPIDNPGLGGRISGGNLTGDGVGQMVGTKARVRVAAFYTASEAITGGLGETAYLKVNGKAVKLQRSAGDVGFQILEAELPITELRFPGATANGYCPWPALNVIWALTRGLYSFVDWSEITFTTTPPVLLVPGETRSWAQPAYDAACTVFRAAKQTIKEAPVPGASGVAAEIWGSVMDQPDACSGGARATWASYLDLIEREPLLVRTTTDMIQRPSEHNSEGSLLCDERAGGSWWMDAPLNFYLGGAAKALGAGVVDVLAYSKGGVDLLHYMTGEYYAEAHEDEDLYIRNVATLGSPYKGSPRALDPIYDPAPRRKLHSLPDGIGKGFVIEVSNTVLDLVLDQWTKHAYGSPKDWLERLIDVPFIVACDFKALAYAEEAVIGDIPSEATMKTYDRLRAGFPGHAPKWITFGANADESGDDFINMSCTGGDAEIFRIVAGETLRDQCIPQDDSGIAVGDAEKSYAYIATTYCKQWSEENGACAEWSELRHNDAVIDLFSAALPGKHHTVLDRWSEHPGHLGGFVGPDDAASGEELPSVIGQHADHLMLLHESRAPLLWTSIKSQLGIPSPPQRTYPEDDWGSRW